MVLKGVCHAIAHGVGSYKYPGLILEMHGLTL